VEIPLWIPSEAQISVANLTAFRHALEQRWAVSLPDFDALHRFSIEDVEKFWGSLWDFAGVIGDRQSDRVLVDGEKIPGALFFPDAKLNFAENLLRRRGPSPAIIYRGENRVRRELSWDELHQQVSRLVQYLRASGIGSGDRCAGFVPNMPEAVVAMLACAAIGATWTSCSPDFGVQGVLDRFGQIEPRVLFAADGYYYNGKAHDSLARVSECLDQLPSVERVLIFPYLSAVPDLLGVVQHGDVVCLEDALEPYLAGPIDFEELPFNHPLYIMYSSGTTGRPKCIVHGAGGTLLQHLKEHRLHCDISAGDRVFYFTTCGWMMWNWLVSALASEATLLLYDGSPAYPTTDVLFDFADEVQMTLFGTSAKYIDAIAKAGIKPRETHRLDALRTMLSTGSPLAAEGFDFVYRYIKRDICLSSISGGTDILACFVGGNPIAPVWRGEIQAPALGMAIDVFDDAGQPLNGQKGELVCTNPFPSMPLGFWDDESGARYHSAYFERFANVWYHGDYMERTEHDGFIIYGRSDATLNPGGVRIGTAEIYRQVEGIDKVLEAVAVGQQWDGDTRILLFVVLRAGVALDQGMRDQICQRIRENCTPRHVPAKILQVADIPRTKSGKITELAVRAVVSGDTVENVEALANPEALAFFAELPELSKA
jgi:acetoacetyl-CoA synthetase